MNKNKLYINKIIHLFIGLVTKISFQQENYTGNMKNTNLNFLDQQFSTFKM